MLTPEEASLVKAMRARGDYNHDIAAWLGTNQGRASEINTGHEHPDVDHAPLNKLPPNGAPVQHLKNAVSTIERALSLVNNGDGDGCTKTLKHYIDNLTRGTEFFKTGSML